MFDKTTKKLTHYLCQKDENKFAGLFANDGVYHDYIYGTFIGKQNIKKMIDNFFYRDAKIFIGKCMTIFIKIILDMQNIDFHLFL